MIEIRKTDNFIKWLDGLNDIHARARILVRIERLAGGNPGDVKRVVKAFQNYGSITGQVTAFITRSKGDL